jgi:hypothetical protein
LTISRRGRTIDDHLDAEVGMKVRRAVARASVAVVAAIGLTLGLSPTAAWAVYYQYALNAYTAEATPRVSVVGTINGGRANLATSGSFRVYIQTVSGGTLLASNYTNTGFTDVYLVHSSYSGVNSRCYWDWLPGSYGISLPLNCWRSV